MDDMMQNIVIGTILLILVFFISLALWGIRFSSIGEGEHSGYITAVDQRGYIFKNYDIYFKTDNSSSQEDVYCINRENKDLTESAKRVNKERKQVTIHYHGVRGIGLGLCEGTEITEIVE